MTMQTNINKSKVGKLLAVWDSLEIIKGQVEFLKENGEYPEKTDDQLFQIAAQDSDLFDFEWESLCDQLTEFMSANQNGGWKAVVEGFGWQGIGGMKTFTATTGKDLLHAILPKTDCTFKIYRHGRGLAINNCHHDSPTGKEWYYIQPCKLEKDQQAA
jgi:hypothetical protein